MADESIRPVADEVESLHELCTIRGKTITQVAEEVDVSKQAISNWNIGLHRPSTKNLKKLSEVLRARPSKLYALVKQAEKQRENRQKNQPQTTT